jgi:hypothetical protein
MPLRCTDMDGGFLGNTLITLVYNRGAGGSEPPPLPTHKLSPNDIVAIKPVAGAAANGEAGSSVIAQGVVYRVSDTRLVVAVEDLGDTEALDVPLRLDKLANKARCTQGPKSFCTRASLRTCESQMHSCHVLYTIQAELSCLVRSKRDLMHV